VCRVREANVAERQLLLVLLESSEQFQAFAGIRPSQRLAHAMKQAARAACLPSEPKPCPCSSRGYDLPVCKATNHSIAYFLHRAWTRNPQIAGTTMRLPRGPRIISFQSSYLNFRGVPRGSQEMGRPAGQAAAASERNSTSNCRGTSPVSAPRAYSSRTARRPSSP